MLKLGLQLLFLVVVGVESFGGGEAEHLFLVSDCHPADDVWIHALNGLISSFELGSRTVQLVRLLRCFQL